MGAFICTISENDWEIARNKGVYGNRLYKEDTGNKLGDVQILSIIRDLISMREEDLVFFHIRRKQIIHGVYRVRRNAYYDEEKIWINSSEPFPFRFLFEPEPNYEYLAKYNANIDVHSLYDLIDKGKIKSLVTLENEQNIEARGVRKILKEDAKNIITILHRDFKRRKSDEQINFDLYNIKNNVIQLKDMIFKVGSIENAIKAIFMYELSHSSSFINELFNENKIIANNIDFINEFFIAQTTRKSIDIYCVYNNVHLLIEAKTNQADTDALRQVLYYRDILLQTSWINPMLERINVIIIAKSFSKDLIISVNKLNKVNNGIKLIKYIPINSGKWGKFEYVY